MAFSATRRRLWWDQASSDGRPTAKIWETLTGQEAKGSFVRAKAIPRHLHAFYDGTVPRTQDYLRWYPYKQELTVNNKKKMSVSELLDRYLPPTLNDDERVKYIALKHNQREQDVAEKIFEMRRMRLFIAQVVRNKLRARSLAMVDGQTMSEAERRFQLATIMQCVALESTMMQSHSFDPHIVFSPHFDVGGCIDMLSDTPHKTALRYHLTEVSVDKSVCRGVLPDCIGQPKYPLENFEPTIYNITMLKLAILAVIIKTEQYVTDNFYDKDHLYMCVIFNVTEDPTSRSHVKTDLFRERCDLDLARKVLEHHYETFVVPQRNMRTK